VKPSSPLTLLRRSIRARLVLVFLVLALATSAVFLVGLQRAVAGGWQTWAQPLLGDYVDRLVAELGSPPEPARAEALSARLPVSVRIEGPQVQYDSRRPRHGHVHDDEEDTDNAHGPFALVRMTADGHRVSFGLSAPPRDWRPRGGGWVPLVALVALTALAYLLVRRWLAPLDAIGAGAERYGRGRFDQPIATPHDDELGRLAVRIDAMAASLHGMLESQRTQLLAISHELRSPLTRARLNAELLPDGEQKAAVVRDLAEMRDLVADLLESERLSAGASALATETVDLAALLRETASDAGLEADLATGVAPVQVDPARLRLLLRNLLANARRHAGEAPEPPRFFLRRAGDALEIGLRDHGPGVPPDVLPRLAEPFYRPDSARTRAAGGTGLGLHLCRRVAEAHGGSLLVRNASPGLEVAMRWRPIQA
jgi:signal transduction histidine kinase